MVALMVVLKVDSKAGPMVDLMVDHLVYRMAVLKVGGTAAMTVDLSVGR